MDQGTDDMVGPLFQHRTIQWQAVNDDPVGYFRAWMRLARSKTDNFYLNASRLPRMHDLGVDPVAHQILGIARDNIQNAHGGAFQVDLHPKECRPRTDTACAPCATTNALGFYRVVTGCQ